MTTIMFSNANGEVTLNVGEPIETVLFQFIGKTKDELIEWAQGELQKQISTNGFYIESKRVLADFVTNTFTGEWSDSFKQSFYNALVWSDTPDSAINPREINYADLPHGAGCREFRRAWVDVTPDPKPDIDLAKAKEIKLAEMRDEREKRFAALGFPVRLSPELEEAIVTPDNKDKLKALRDATEPLKALNATGYNDEAILEQVRVLGKFNVAI